jgi:hypothetical protein
MKKFKKNHFGTFSVRHPILRDGKPIEDCHFEGDIYHLPNTFN